MTHSTRRAAWAVGVFFAAAATAWGQYQTQSARGGTQVNVYPNSTGVGRIGLPGQVGVANNPLANFGQVGGFNTLTFGTGLGAGVGGGIPAPDYRSGVQANVSGGNGIGRALARQGRLERTTSALLGRANGGFASGDFGYGVKQRGSILTGPGLTLGSSFAAGGMSGYRGGMTPGLSLDRYEFLGVRSNMARNVLGSRGARELEQRAQPTDPLTEPRSEDEKFEVPPLATIPELENTQNESRAAPRAQIELELVQTIERGDEWMRDGEYARARAAYDTARLLNEDDPRGYMRLFLVSLMSTDVYRAMVSFRHGLKRVKTVDDLRINLGDTIGTNTTKLRGVMRELSQQANRPKAVTGVILMYAYGSWLTGDQAVAERAIERAIESAPDQEDLARLGQLLKNNPATPSAGAKPAGA